jgi:hypothetical protein
MWLTLDIVKKQTRKLEENVFLLMKQFNEFSENMVFSMEKL